MKKMKLVLLAAMIIGIGSAFTTAQPLGDRLVIGPDGVTLINIDEAEELQGHCDSGLPGTCKYFLDESPDTFSGTGQYVYP